MKKGISLIILVITIVVIIVLTATTIIILNNNGVITNAKITSLASDRNTLQSSIEVYCSNVISSNLNMDYDRQAVLLGEYDDSHRIVEKDGDKLSEITIEKNGEKIVVYKLNKELCKTKEIKIENEPSNDSNWYITKDGEVFLVYDEDAVIDEWIAGNFVEGKQVENDTLDVFIAKIGGEGIKQESGVTNIIPVADSNMFSYTNVSNGTVQIKGFNPEYNGEIPSEIKFPVIDANGNNILGISINAFKNNNNITKIIIPEGITKIGNNAFDSCENLKEVHLPTTLNSIFNSGNSPFNNCKKIEKIVVPNYVMSSSNYCPSYIFPNSKDSISSVSFVGEITAISSRALKDFTSLKSITIPNTVTTINNEAFSGCVSLSGKIIIPENVTTIGRKAFENCSKIQSIELLSNGSLKSISEQAFKGLKLITSIKIPEGVTSIGNNAFDSCENLKEVYLPTTLNSIFNSGNSPFYNCNKIEKITVPNYVMRSSNYCPSAIFTSSKGTINSVNFVGEITQVGSRAFRDFTALNSITIPSTVTSIGAEAFYGCTNLTKIVYSGTASGRTWGATNATVVAQ